MTKKRAPKDTRPHAIHHPNGSQIEGTQAATESQAWLRYADAQRIRTESRKDRIAKLKALGFKALPIEPFDPSPKLPTPTNLN